MWNVNENDVKYGHVTNSSERHVTQPRRKMMVLYSDDKLIFLSGV